MRNFELKVKKQWNEVYVNDNFTKKPQRNLPQIANFFKLNNISRILDLGCGSGRNIVYLAKEGFEMYGLDISSEGVHKTKLWLKKEGVNASLKVRSMYGKLPYQKNYFDAIMCIRTLNHGTIQDIRKAISEIKRILKPNGFIYLTVVKGITKSLQKDYTFIDSRTYVPLGGREKGVIHYLFNKNILEKEFKDFKIIKLSTNKSLKNKDEYYVLFGKLNHKPNLNSRTN